MANKSFFRVLYLSTRAIRTVVKDASRAREITTILAKYGFTALLSSRNLRPWEKKDKQLKGSGGGDLADRLVSLIEELGPTFVKFGQILSTRPDLIPPSLCARMAGLQDHVSPVPLADIRHQIEDALGGPPEEYFASFDEKPMASASIAQVHTAVTHDGEQVVLKVQRPHLRRTIESDLSLLRFFCQRMVDVFPEAELMDLPGMIEEFEASLIRELDFTEEARSIRRFTENFADKPLIHLPKVYDKLSTSTVITLERIYGTKLTELDTKIDADEVAGLYLDATYQMLFQDGFFHGDLHPGNVFLEDDGRLGLIDFGMVGHLSRGMREKVVDVIFSVLREDLEGVARIWYSLGTPVRSVNYSQFETDVVGILEKYAVGRPLDDLDIGGFLRELAEGAVRHGIRLPSSFTMMFKAMITTEGLARMVCEGVNPIEAARPYIEVVIKDRYSKDRLKSRGFSELIQLTDLAGQLPSRLDRLLGQAEQGEAQIHLRHKDLNPLMSKLVRAKNRQAVALLTASAGVTTALTASLPGMPSLGGLSVLSWLSLMVVGAGTTWIAAGILRGK
ncbi:MAG: AarF/ABC1/UbiB kinase family protein [Deltaproteobacteria bacterium]|nr:AarF/ABC1/UbiB kinase family protein [Deltaproteobacteria bacterium]